MRIMLGLTDDDDIDWCRNSALGISLVTLVETRVTTPRK